MEPITFVTGGTGFLGRYLIPTLCYAGHTVRVLTRDPDAHPWLARYPRVEVVRGDVLDASLIRDSIAGCTYVVHAAGLFRFWGSRAAFEATNIGGATNVLQAAASSPTLKKLIHVSTVALIGKPEPNRIIDENHPACPADNYQRSKLQAEQLMLRYYAEQQIPVVILRPGAFYGPLGTYAFNRLFFKDPMRGIIMQVNNGRYVTFPVYIGDAAQAILLALEYGRIGEIYNISGESLTHKEAFDIICAEGNIHFPRLTIPGWLGIAVAQAMTAISAVTQREPFWPITLRSYVYNYWNVSSEKAKRELGFVPLDFREGARRTLAWYRSGQPDRLAELEC